jgi:hypothetical protein
MRSDFPLWAFSGLLIADQCLDLTRQDGTLPQVQGAHGLTKLISLHLLPPSPALSGQNGPMRNAAKLDGRGVAIQVCRKSESGADQG